MKKLTIITAGILILSCCGTKEKTQDQIKQDYLEKAQKYYDINISKFEQDEIASIDLQKVDSIFPVSTMMYEDFKLNPLRQQMARQQVYLNQSEEMVELFESGHEEYRRELENTKEIAKKIHDKLLEVKDLPDNDTVAIGVLFIAQYTQKDGAKLKQQQIGVLFDKQGDIDAKIMNIILKGE